MNPLIKIKDLAIHGGWLALSVLCSTLIADGAFGSVDLSAIEHALITAVGAGVGVIIEGIGQVATEQAAKTDG